MKIKDVVLGIDLGGTIHQRNSDDIAIRMPHSFETISKLVDSVKGVYIVSKVTDKQSMGAYKWFLEHNFFERTKLTPNKIHFCYERNEKGPICERLGINHFIDDRPQVMLHMPESVKHKILMNPSAKDIENFGTVESHVFNNWIQVYDYFFNNIYYS